MHGLLAGPLPVFIAQAALIIVLSRLIGLGSRRIGQPMVVAEIAAGILLGPSLLGWIAPGFSKALFPKESLGLLGMTSQIGLILFMFLIGLELDPKLLRGRAKSSVAISHSSIAVPFGLGALLALRVHGDLSPAGVPLLPFVLFMGAAMSITAFPVLARILVERRLLRSRVGAITIACAAVDDVTAWCILAFVVSIARASDAMSGVRTVVLALAYVGVMVYGVRPFLGRLADRTKIGLSQNIVAVILVALLLSSWATELIGIHALFGAFLFGAILPKEGSLGAALAEKIEDIVVVFMLPLFFAYSGLRTQIGLLDTPGAWGTAGLIILVACAGKFGGSFVAARFTGMPWREAGAVGILMNTRGLMELIVLNVGLDLGVISPALFTMMVVMALVTTFMTTPLLGLVYPISEIEKEVAEPAPPSSALPSTFTALVCVSHERSGRGLVTLGAALAGPSRLWREQAEKDELAGLEARRSRSLLYALRLLPPNERASFVLDQQREGEPDLEHETALEPLLDRARELHVKVRPLSFVSNVPAHDICDVASVKKADVILLGWHKPLLGASMLGGVTSEVMSAAPCDVGVLVDRGLDVVRKILVAYVGSDHDRAAMRLAKRIAENTGAEVTILHVVPRERGERLGAEATVREELPEVAAEDGQLPYKVIFKVVTHDVPAEAAIEESASGYDLLLVGVGRQWGLGQASFGGRAEALLARAHTSVLVVRRPVARPSTVSDTASRRRFATVPPTA